MPSYFYHIALDIHSSPRPDSFVVFSPAEYFDKPFKAITIQRPVSPSAKVSPSLQILDETLTSEKTSGLPLESSSRGRSKDERGALGYAHSESGVKDSTSLWVRSDWRYDRIFVQVIDMAHMAAGTKQEGPRDGGRQITNRITVGPGGSVTKGKFEQLNLEEGDLGWGIIRLYRDNEETPGLYDDDSIVKGPRSGRTRTHQHNRHESPIQDEDCTTLCILAVPSYLTPSDFLGFVGEKTRNEVSHFRMIRTERSNRYMVLMKFRSGSKAREWRKEWNGRAFDGMEVHDYSPRCPCERVSRELTMKLFSPKTAMWFSSSRLSCGYPRQIVQSLLFLI